MKQKDYVSDSLISIDRSITILIPHVTLTGKDLSIQELFSIARLNAHVDLTKNTRIIQKITDCYDRMISDVKDGTPIYGCNTGYGARAEKVVNQGTREQRLKLARAISESIVHTDISVGPELSRDVVRAAMLIRLNMLLNGASGVKLNDLELIQKILNLHITPVVHAYGGLGASGDLAHNGRIVSVLRQLPDTRVRDEKNRIQDARKALRRRGVPPLVLEPKAGLGLVNGDNFSTAAACLITVDILRCSLIADVLGAMMIEVLRGTNRTFHPFLSTIRPHKGQTELSGVYRYLLEGSKLAYQEMVGQKPRPAGVNIQDAYSLRCISQSEGFNREQIKWALNTITVNANSVSDNPLWVPPEHTTAGEQPWQWVSGGNFFALHMAEVIDVMRKIITRLIKRNDRHLHRLVSPHYNNGLPANLSDSSAISSCTFKGIQLQSGMFDVYSMMLAQPVTTMFGVHEESNQDITPHSLTSAILAWENLRILRYSLAMNLLAVAQAVDLRGGPKLLSSRTKPLYEFIRKHSAYVRRERPLSYDIEQLAQRIEDGTLPDVIRKDVFRQYSS